MSSGGDLGSETIRQCHTLGESPPSRVTCPLFLLLELPSLSETCFRASMRPLCHDHQLYQLCWAVRRVQHITQQEKQKITATPSLLRCSARRASALPTGLAICTRDCGSWTRCGQPQAEIALKNTHSPSRLTRVIESLRGIMMSIERWGGDCLRPTPRLSMSSTERSMPHRLSWQSIDGLTKIGQMITCGESSR